jgi:acetoin utilization protein AcuC
LSGRAAIVHDVALENYGFGGDHPFNPLRVRLALELCEALGLLEDYRFVSCGSATDEDLTTVHSLTYVRMVQKAGRGTCLACWTTVSGPRTIPSSPICTGPAPAW